ncbi:hypothetical protein MSAR_02930 [Mycolicibacterium sarraceniae]|uniref:Cyclopropane-fatty-acyl-phospholipid synthase n=1 Tax=Mycolicibacterium sarraceniae TaxID=1534348 RepID=A0A7I7SJN3_9MYCO|nr:hypothetical protein MSAR_02930 [Mycolicibacterium sarraceniae]
MLNVAQRLEALVGTADGATAHHYDLSNDFYRLLLDDHVAYSSACFTDDRQTLPEAQTEKVDLICRKRVLAEGLRLLDVGCGWGSLILFAARRYGGARHRYRVFHTAFRQPCSGFAGGDAQFVEQAAPRRVCAIVMHQKRGVHRDRLAVPVIEQVSVRMPPTRLSASNNVTRFRRASTYAAVRPATPPPTTASDRRPTP